MTIRRYSTEIGVCAVDAHEITDSPAIENKGYLSPKPASDEVFDVGGQAKHRYTFDRLCREHYLEAFKEVYPGAELPAI